MKLVINELYQLYQLCSTLLSDQTLVIADSHHDNCVHLAQCIIIHKQIKRTCHRGQVQDVGQVKVQTGTEGPCGKAPACSLAGIIYSRA
eukprot:1075720-Pelagomonas_calceolata.AAC.2